MMNIKSSGTVGVHLPITKLPKVGTIDEEVAAARRRLAEGVEAEQPKEKVDESVRGSDLPNY